MATPQPQHYIFTLKLYIIVRHIQEYQEYLTERYQDIPTRYLLEYSDKYRQNDPKFTSTLWLNPQNLCMLGQVFFCSALSGSMKNSTSPGL